MIRRLTLLIILLSVISSVSNSQIISPGAARAALITRIDSILQSQVDLDKIPGAVIEIKKADKIIYRHAYGYAQKYDYPHRLLKTPEKMSVSHLFDIASLTKVIGTTTSIMLLADRGLLGVEDRGMQLYQSLLTLRRRKISQ